MTPSTYLPTLMDDLPIFCPKCNRGLSVRRGVAFCHNADCIRRGHGVWRIVPEGRTLHLEPAGHDDEPEDRAQHPPWLATLILAGTLGLILLVFFDDLAAIWQGIVHSFDTLPF